MQAMTVFCYNNEFRAVNCRGYCNTLLLCLYGTPHTVHAWHVRLATKQGHTEARVRDRKANGCLSEMADAHSLLRLFVCDAWDLHVVLFCRRG